MFDPKLIATPVASYFIDERMRQASYEMVNEMVMKCTGYNFIIVLFI